MLKMCTGHRVSNDVQELKARFVNFDTADGRTMFSVRVGDDGRSIEVSAVDNCVVDETMYSTCLMVEPRVTNVVYIRTAEYPV